MTDVVYDTIPMPENIDFLIRRIKAWRNIQIKPNGDKKIAVLYWNHPPGKQNVGASYLNLFRSLKTIIPAMKKSGYGIEGPYPLKSKSRNGFSLAAEMWGPGRRESWTN